MQVVLPPFGGGPQPGMVVRGITRVGLLTLAVPVLDRAGHLIEEADARGWDRCSTACERIVSPGALTPTLSQRERE